ncbi:hypothetical protein DPSP01_003902 [Paraphaeosphaeria sporulosa]
MQASKEFALSALSSHRSSAKVTGEYASYRHLLRSSRLSRKTQLQEDPVSVEAHNMLGHTYRHTDWGTVMFVSRAPGRTQETQFGLACLERSRGAPCGLLRSMYSHCTNDGSWTRAVSWIWSQCHGRLSTAGVCLLLQSSTKSVSEFAT